jgi:hypothetical protein
MLCQGKQSFILSELKQESIMITRPITVFGDKGKGQRKAEGATPENIDPIGKPQVHLISGATGSGKSVVARNMLESYDEAHKKARSKVPPAYLIYTGAGGDPVWDGSGDRVKIYSPKEEQEFIDAVNLHYDRAMRQKSSTAPPPSTGATATGGEDVMKTLAAASAISGGNKDDDKHRPAMVIIDDAAASGLIPAQMGRSPIAQALQSHRHADMSFVVSSQRYHNHNPWLRANAASVNIFPPKGAEELNFLKRDLPIPHPSMIRGFQVAAAKGTHSFIHVDMKNRQATHDFSGEHV